MLYLAVPCCTCAMLLDVCHTTPLISLLGRLPVSHLDGVVVAGMQLVRELELDKQTLKLSRRSSSVPVWLQDLKGQHANTHSQNRRSAKSSLNQASKATTAGM